MYKRGVRKLSVCSFAGLSLSLSLSRKVARFSWCVSFSRKSGLFAACYYLPCRRLLFVIFHEPFLFVVHIHRRRSRRRWTRAKHEAAYARSVASSTAVTGRRPVSWKSGTVSCSTTSAAPRRWHDPASHHDAFYYCRHLLPCSTWTGRRLTAPTPPAFMCSLTFCVARAKARHPASRRGIPWRLNQR